VPYSRIRTDPRLKTMSRQTIVSHALAMIQQGIGG
jgi:hypothetical protein